jgi:hypothetical protein
MNAKSQSLLAGPNKEKKMKNWKVSDSRVEENEDDGSDKPRLVTYFTLIAEFEDPEDAVAFAIKELNWDEKRDYSEEDQFVTTENQVFEFQDGFGKAWCVYHEEDENDAKLFMQRNF